MNLGAWERPNESRTSVCNSTSTTAKVLLSQVVFFFLHRSENMDLFDHFLANSEFSKDHWVQWCGSLFLLKQLRDCSVDIDRNKQYDQTNPLKAQCVGFRGVNWH